jgi:hypothetical protein
MATYKMIQDIEAEDHIIGPLSLRQFIYALVCALFLYINFVLLTKHLAFLMIIFLPPAIFTGFFAFPFGGDQPTEVWALAKIRFWFKPRQRIWDQSGVKELVTVTVPKKIERNLTNGLTQIEVKSRLSALANTIDSRGWAVKNVNVNLYAGLSANQNTSDRLIDISTLPQEVQSYDVDASDDIMDERNNPIAHQFDSLINASSQAHHQQLINQMNAGALAQVAPIPPAAPADYWFMNQPAQQAQLPANQAVFAAPYTVIPGTVPQAVAPPIQSNVTEEAFIAKVHADEAREHESKSNLHTIQPLSTQPVSGIPIVAAPVLTTPVPVPIPSSPDPVDPAILSLARNNDLNIATLAREAHKSQKSDGANDGEVVISLR